MKTLNIYSEYKKDSVLGSIKDNIASVSDKNASFCDLLHYNMLNTSHKKCPADIIAQSRPKDKKQKERIFKKFFPFLW